MSPAGDQRNPIDRLAESFVERYRQGEVVSPEDYAERHPELADEIRSLFPTLILMEELRPGVHVEATEPDGGTHAAAVERVPRILGAYEVVRELGRGGMGTVYEALRTDHRAGEPAARVAMKFIHPHLIGEGAHQERFLREAQIGARVEHPNVVRTLEAGIWEDERGLELPYLVLEFVEGTSLRELAVSLGGIVPEALLRHLARQLVRGLEAIHALGIVHRDLKPSNVLVTPEHRVRIMDLGVARLHDASDRVSETGQFVGSVRYAAPEQFRGGGDAIGPPTDLYALGVTLYELATGSHPFPVEGPRALMLAHLSERPRPARARNQQLSPFFSALLDVLLEKDPALRIDSASALHVLLDSAESSAWWGERREEAGAEDSLVTRPPVARHTPFRGRGDVLSVLARARQEASNGAGRVVLLHGEPGVGKTRLIDTWAESLAPENVRVLYGSFPPGGRADGLRQAVVAAFGSARLKATLERHLAHLPDLLPAFAAHLAELEAPSDATPLEANALRALYVGLMRALAVERPLVWVIEDVDFAPPETFRTILALVRAVPKERVLLLLTSSQPSSTLMEEIRESEHAEAVPVARLDRDDCRAILSHALGTAPWVEHLAERIATESGGNPFFLTEMIKEVQAIDEARRREGRSSIGIEHVRRLPVPAAVRELVQNRVRSIGEQERPILESGAVLGFEFDPVLVASALDRDLLEVLQVLGALERRSGIVRSAGDLYRFDHHQIQDVLAEDLAPPLRRAYHHRLAAAIVRDLGGAGEEYPADLPGDRAAMLADHAYRGGLVKLGHRVVLDAVLHHVQGFAHGEALELCRRALAADPPPEVHVRGQLLIQGGVLTDLLGLSEEYGRFAEWSLAAAEALDDPVFRTAAYRMFGTWQVKQGAMADAERWMRRALETIREVDRPAEEANVLLNLASVIGNQGRFDDCVALGAEAKAIGERIGKPSLVGRALFSMATYASYAGRHLEALPRLRACLTALADAGASAERTRVRAHGAIGNVYFSLGDYVQAKESYERSIQRAYRIGDREAAATSLGNLGGVLVALGRLGDALESFRAEGALLAEIGGLAGKEMVWRANHGSARAAVGDFAGARRLLDESARRARTLNNARMEAYVMHDLARMDVAEARFEAAEAGARKALALREALGREGLAESHLLLGALAVERGDAAAAASHFREAAARAQEASEPAATARARAWLAILGEEDVSEIALPEHMARLEEAELRLLLARAGAQGDHRGEARRILGEAEVSLPPEYRSGFRARNPVCRLLSATPVV